MQRPISLRILPPKGHEIKDLMLAVACPIPDRTPMGNTWYSAAGINSDTLK